jgi:hypothetical protein
MRSKLERVALWVAVAPALFLQVFVFGGLMTGVITEQLYGPPAPIVVPQGADAGSELGGRLMEAALPMILIAMAVPFFWCLAGCLLLVSLFLKHVARKPSTPKTRQMSKSDRIAYWLLVGPALATGTGASLTVIMDVILKSSAGASFASNPIFFWVTMLLFPGSIFIAPVAWFAAACIVISPRLLHRTRNETKNI